MKVDRSPLAQALVAFGRAGSGVVVGSPGVGKSYLMVQSGDILAAQASPVLLLPVDQLGDATVNNLQSYLGFTGDFIARLRDEATGFAPGQVGIVLVDGFDAARSEVARSNVLDWIRRVLRELRASWHVVVSVRRYDAQKSQDLQQLFPAGDANVVEPSTSLPGISCRHFAVPELSDAEVRDAASQIGLQPNRAGNFGPVEPLLRIPFHLWLIERILGTSTTRLEEVTRASSQAELLDVYWSARITGTNDAEARQVLVARATQAMLRDQRLIVPIEELFEPGLSATLSAMFSDEIFVRPVSDTLAAQFAHNILFDDMVSRQVPLDSLGLVGFLVEDPARVLFLRPSLVLYYSRAWHKRREQFWASYWDLILSDNPAVRLASRLLPTRTIVGEAAVGEDALPIAEAVQSGRPGSQLGALLLLRAIRADSVQASGRWLPMLGALAENIEPLFANELMLVAAEGLDRAADSSLHHAVYGAIARNVVRWSFNIPGKVWGDYADQVASIWGVPVMARTIAADPTDTSSLIRRLLDLMESEPDFPVQYFYRLCDQVESIWNVEAELASRIYVAGFLHEERSTAVTRMGGFILPMSSTRRQDYELAQYVLLRHFPAFLVAHPSGAVTGAIEVVNSFAELRHVRPNLKEGYTPASLTRTFPFRGRDAKYLPDLSYIWDASSYPDRQVELANSVMSWLAEVANSPDQELVNSILDTFRDHTRAAFWWRRLLLAASQLPAIFADRLIEVVTAAPVLEGADTVREAGQFIEAAFGIWTPEQRAMVESAVIALPGNDPERREVLESFRSRLLGRMDPALIQLAEARELRLDLESRSRLPSNEPLVQYAFSSEPYTREDWLKDEGADPDRVDNRRLTEFSLELDRFASEWQNRTPSEEKIRDSRELAADTFQALRDTTAQLPVATSAWASLAGWAQTVSRLCPLLPKDILDLVRDILLSAAVHPAPIPDPKRDAEYNSPSWYPAPRFEAAQGIPRLLLQARDVDVSEALIRLCADPVPGVRYLTAISLGPLAVSQPDLFWACTSDLVEHERNAVVIGGLAQTLASSIAADTKRSIGLLLELVNRGLSGSLPGPPGEAIANLAVVGLGGTDPEVIALFERLLSDPIQYRDALANWTMAQSHYITLSSARTPIGDAAIGSCRRAVTAIRQVLADRSDLTRTEPDATRDLLQTVDQIAARIYFGSGLHDAETSRSPMPALTDLAFYYRKVRPLMEDIVEFGRLEPPLLLAGTAHFLMQFIRRVTAEDPLGVLDMAVKIASAGRGGGYTLDSMAQQEVVALVEQLLADHRDVLRSSPGLDNLESLLNLFADVGWPEAIQLVWRLDEVFR